MLALAHGAGAGMRHPFMEKIARALAEEGVSTLRYEFEYMEKGVKRPDPPAVAQRRVREAVEAAARESGGVPVFAGGKSFGGRMTSQAAAAGLIDSVRGLVFLGFPLHPPGKPGIERAEHLDAVRVPMLFLQGTRDTFARLDLLEPVVSRLRDRATLHVVEEGDHSFNVPKRTGLTPAQVIAQLARAIGAWSRRVLA